MQENAIEIAKLGVINNEASIENNKQINVSEEINSSGTYYLSVKDAVGNISEVKSIKIISFNIKKLQME